MANIEIDIMTLLRKNNLTLSQIQHIFDSILTIIQNENPITI